MTEAYALDSFIPFIQTLYGCDQQLVIIFRYEAADASEGEAGLVRGFQGPGPTHAAVEGMNSSSHQISTGRDDIRSSS